MNGLDPAKLDAWLTREDDQWDDVPEVEGPPRCEAEVLSRGVQCDYAPGHDGPHRGANADGIISWRDGRWFVVHEPCEACNDTGVIITADAYDGIGRYQPETDVCPHCETVPS